MSTELKDSGERQKFTTGAVRDIQTGKGLFSLLPSLALFLVARVYEDGAKKYGRDNWKKGIPISRFIDSALRHLHKYLDGLRDEPHLSQAAWNILGALWTAAMVQTGQLPKELNDVSEPAVSPHEQQSLATWYDLPPHNPRKDPAVALPKAA